MAITVFPAPSTGGTAKSETSVMIKSTGTWLCPAGVTQVEVILCGGGGGGPGLNGTIGNRNGGSGSVFYDFLTVNPGTTYTITIGAGGAGTVNATGNNGASSTFGALMTATGGSGGNNNNDQPAGAGLGGAASYYHNNATGSPFLFPASPGAFGLGGGGGAARGNWGDASTAGANGGGRGNTAIDGGNARANTGSGGGAAGNVGGPFTLTGGNGGSGVCIIRYWS